jgi:hypothetical protein
MASRMNESRQDKTRQFREEPVTNVTAVGAKRMPSMCHDANFPDFGWAHDAVMV